QETVRMHLHAVFDTPKVWRTSAPFCARKASTQSADGRFGPKAAEPPRGLLPIHPATSTRSDLTRLTPSPTRVMHLVLSYGITACDFLLRTPLRERASEPHRGISDWLVA